MKRRRVFEEKKVPGTLLELEPVSNGLICLPSGGPRRVEEIIRLPLANPLD